MIKFNLVYFLVIVTHVLIELYFSLFTDEISQNPFLKQYDKLNYDTKHLHDRHLRVQRSIDNHLYFTFNSHGRNFNLKLEPSAKHFYGNGGQEAAQNFAVELESIKLDVNKLVNFYDGVLVDEPDSSYVSGTIIDGIFYGTIQSDKLGKFFVESSKRYNSTMNAHSIIYHESDINLNGKNNRKKRSDTQVGHEDDDHLSCGSTKEHIRNNLVNEQKKLYDERRRVEGFDPYSYIDKEKYHLEDDLIDNLDEFKKYSKEANKKRKREASPNIDPKRLTFPDQRTMCDLYLRVDPQLHAEIFRTEGNEDNAKTTAFILFYLNKHVEALNTIYNGLQFFDSNKENYFVGLQFMIYRTKIITEEQCKSKKNLTEEEFKLCEPYLDVSTFLNYVSLDNFNDYCLSYTFTARDFVDGTLGLAWVAKLTGSVGGVCERRQTLQGVSKSLNSGIVTVVNYKARVPEAVSQITFAHEVGHNFGSEHDPDDSLCSPGTSKGGNFIMYRRATTGTDRNNRNFSQCSKDQMGPIIHSLVANPNKFCFKQYNGSLCGNGIVEPGEECDCGYSNECKETKCCYDADERPGEKCRLKPNAKCSPSQGPCCDPTCNFAQTGTVCMQSDECLNNVTCTGRDAFCPHNSSHFFKPSLTICNSGTQVCRNGICTGSICERFEMTQCYLEGNLKDKKQDKAVLCHLACVGPRTNNQCVDSFKIEGMVDPMKNSGLILKPGSPCVGTLGYCDIFSKCRSVDGEGPLLRLKNLLFNPVTLSKIRTWITTYWWGVILMIIGLLIFMVAFIKVCSVHTPSSNPQKPPALKITDTLRRPIKRLPNYQNYQISLTTKATNYQANITKPTNNNNNNNYKYNYTNDNKRAQAAVGEKYQKNLNLNTKTTKNIPAQKTSANQANRVKPENAANRLNSQQRYQNSSDEYYARKGRLEGSGEQEKVSTMSRIRLRFKSTESISHYYKNHLFNKNLLVKQRSKSQQLPQSEKTNSKTAKSTTDNLLKKILALLTKNNALINADQPHMEALRANGDKEILSKVKNLEIKFEFFQEKITKKQQETIALVKNSNERLSNKLKAVTKLTENTEQSAIVGILEKKLDTFQENITKEQHETLAAITIVRNSNEVLNKNLSIVKNNIENTEHLAMVEILGKKLDTFQENIKKEQQETVMIVKNSNEVLTKKLSILRKNIQNSEQLAKVDNLELKFDAFQEKITNEQQATLVSIASVKNSNEELNTKLSIATKNTENTEQSVKENNLETKLNVFQENITKEQQATLAAIASVKNLNETLDTKLSITAKNTENTEQLLRGFINEMKNNNYTNDQRLEAYEPCDYGYYSNNIPKQIRITLNRTEPSEYSEKDEEMSKHTQNSEEHCELIIDHQLNHGFSLESTKTIERINEYSLATSIDQNSDYALISEPIQNIEPNVYSAATSIDQQSNHELNSEPIQISEPHVYSETAAVVTSTVQQPKQDSPSHGSSLNMIANSIDQKSNQINQYELNSELIQINEPYFCLETAALVATTVQQTKEDFILEPSSQINTNHSIANYRKEMYQPLDAITLNNVYYSNNVSKCPMPTSQNDTTFNENISDQNHNSNDQLATDHNTEVKDPGFSHELNREPILMLKQNVSTISGSMDQRRNHSNHSTRILTSTKIATKPPKHPFSRKSLNYDLSNFEFA